MPPAEGNATSSSFRPPELGHLLALRRLADTPLLARPAGGLMPSALSMEKRLARPCHCASVSCQGPPPLRGAMTSQLGEATPTVTTSPSTTPFHIAANFDGVIRYTESAVKMIRQGIFSGHRNTARTAGVDGEFLRRSSRDRRDPSRQGVAAGTAEPMRSTCPVRASTSISDRTSASTASRRAWRAAARVRDASSRSRMSDAPSR
jgi:hypothetical protein